MSEILDTDKDVTFTGEATIGATTGPYGFGPYGTLWQESEKYRASAERLNLQADELEAEAAQARQKAVECLEYAERYMDAANAVCSMKQGAA